MTIAELTSRLDQGWRDIEQYRREIRLLAEHGRIVDDAKVPEELISAAADLTDRIIRACAILVLSELCYRERIRGNEDAGTT